MEEDNTPLAPSTGGEDDVAAIAAKIAEREKQRAERKQRSVYLVVITLTLETAEARLAMLKKEEEEERAKQEERRKRQCVSWTASGSESFLGGHSLGPPSPLWTHS